MTRSTRLRTEYHAAHAALDGVSRRGYASAVDAVDRLERLAYRAWCAETSLRIARAARVGGAR